MYSKVKLAKISPEPRLARGDGACCSKCAGLIKRGKMKPKATCDPCKIDRVIRSSAVEEDLED
jgi:hypothetical protein